MLAEYTAEQTAIMDRRGADRFPIERDIRYRVITKRGVCEEGFGKTINISSNGVLFTTDRVLSPGKRVELSISWPDGKHRGNWSKAKFLRWVARWISSAAARRLSPMALCWAARP